MANSAAVCTSFKKELLLGSHNFGTGMVRAATTVDSFKAALYLASGSLGAATTAYSATSEVSGTNYSAGGISVTNATPPSTSGTTAIWTPSASLVYTTVTLSTSFDAVLIYNTGSTQANAAVAVYTFGATTITAGTFTLNMPTNDASNALLRIT